MRKLRILVVDDESGMLEVCKDTLSSLPDVAIELESDSRCAADRLGNERFDLLITDIQMPGLSGIDLLRLGRESDDGLPVLVVTAYPSVETMTATMESGATGYITKPFHPDTLMAAVCRLLGSSQRSDAP